MITAFAERRIARTLLIDADDTLWENNIFYLRCTADFLDLVDALGFNRVEAQRTLDHCEQEVIPILGYGPKGYVAAVQLACQRLHERAGRAASADLLTQVRRLGEPVLHPPMVLLPEVELTLQILRLASRLVLVTKGDEAAQRAKIARSGLEPLFDAVYIVPEKNVAAYRRIADELQLDRGATWMVGNSPKSDINPAIECGLGAILIPHDHTWTAEHEEIAQPDKVTILERFADLPRYFGIEEVA